MVTRDSADLSGITIVPGQRSGEPCIRGLRVTVWDVLDMLASGMTEHEILNDYRTWRKRTAPPYTPVPRGLAGIAEHIEASA